MGQRFQIRLADHWIELSEGSTTIGRDSDVAIVLDDDLVSRNHAVIEIAEGRALLRDLGSRNGTFVNAARVDDVVELNDGDRIGIGSHVLEFCTQLAGQVQGKPTVAGRRLPTLAAVPAEAAQTQEMDVMTRYVQLGRWREVETLVKSRVAEIVEQSSPLSREDPKAVAVLEALTGLAEQSMSPKWADRLFLLSVSQGWLLPPVLLDRLYRVIRAAGQTGGDGLAEYVSYWTDARRFADVNPEYKSRLKMMGVLIEMYQRNR